MCSSDLIIMENDRAKAARIVKVHINNQEEAIMRQIQKEQGAEAGD